MDPIFDLFATFFKDSKPAEFSQNLLLFSIAWYVVRKTVKAHFLSIEEKVERMATSMVRLEQSLSRVESSHAERILKLEGRVFPDKE
jgi:hypothetical protein